MKRLEQYLVKQGWKEDWQETRRDLARGLEVTGASKLYDLYKKNRYVNMNANVLLASAPDIEAGGLASKCLANAGCSPLPVTLGANVVSWLAYLPVHMGLHYASNRQRFKQEDGSFDQRAFWKDVAQVYKTQIPSILLFYALASPAQYLLTRAGMDAHTAQRATYWGTLGLTRAVHTYNYWADRNGKQTLGKVVKNLVGKNKAR